MLQYVGGYLGGKELGLWGGDKSPIQQYQSPEPNRPTYNQPYNPLSMSLYPDVQGLMPNAMNTQGLDKFRGEALRTGPSTWADLANKKQDLEELTARERGTRDVAGQTAQARTSLAMRGGLDSGARERIASGGAKNFLNMSQEVGRQGNQNRLQIATNDEQNRVQQLGMLPGMEVQAQQPGLERARMLGQARQTDIANQIHAGDAHNAFDMQAYQELMQRYAADRTANAIERAGS